MSYQLIDTVTPDVGAKTGAEKINNNAVQAQYQGGYFVATGTANAITLTSGTGAPTAYTAGQEVCFRANATNTGAATVNVDGLGIKSIKTESGADIPSGYLSTSADTRLRYDGVNFIANIPARAVLAATGRNLITNGDLSVNQRAVSGTVVLAAGEYGHDRFRGGSSGCTYTFATSLGKTTLTITAGTLEQEIEGTVIPDGKDVILSWEGTAQGRIDGGTYGTSGNVTGTTTGGANITVEFNTGTLELVQLEFGDTATDFEYVDPATQLARCRRYTYNPFYLDLEAFSSLGVGIETSATVTRIVVHFPTSMRGKPSMTASGTFESQATGTDVTLSYPSNLSNTNQMTIDCTAVSGTPFAVGNCGIIRRANNTNAKVIASAEL